MASALCFRFMPAAGPVAASANTEGGTLESLLPQTWKILQGEFASHAVGPDH
jgi:hypothetical protein